MTSRAPLKIFAASGPFDDARQGDGAPLSANLNKNVG
jgi:hypothetical protein